MNNIIMHINFCEQGQSIPQICQRASEWGFDGVEFRNTPTGMSFPTTGEYMDRIAESVKESHLKQVIFGYQADGVCSSDADVRNNAVKSAIEFITMASHKLGVTVCNVFTDTILDKSIPYGPDYSKHGSSIATDDQWNNAVESYRLIGAAAQKLSMRLGFETHMSYIHDRPEASIKLVKLVDCPAVGINMDYGNTVYFAGCPELKDTIALYGDKLFDLHLKNSIGLSTGERIPTALGEGEINHREYLTLLKQVGYNGPVTLEAPRSGDRELYARQDIAYYKALRQEVGFI